MFVRDNIYAFMHVIVSNHVQTQCAWTNEVLYCTPYPDTWYLCKLLSCCNYCDCVYY